MKRFFIFAALISFLVFLIYSVLHFLDESREFTFYYRNPALNVVTNEVKSINIYKRGKEGAIYNVLTSFLLGPADARLRNVATEKMKVSSVYINKNTIYVNFNSETILEMHKVNEQLLLECLLSTLHANFPKYGEAVFSFGGRGWDTLTGRVTYRRPFPIRPYHGLIPASNH